MTHIPDKATMFRLLHAGALGNHFALWPDEHALRAALDQGFSGRVGVRCVGRVSGLPYATQLDPEAALACGRTLARTYGCSVCYSEASPNELITLQGELADRPEGYQLEWTAVRRPLRQAFAGERRSEFDYHLPALIRQHFGPADLNDLERLFAHYSGCTVEFFAYSQCVGVWPGRLVVVWEARHY